MSASLHTTDRPLRVLFIDDEPILSRAVQRALRGHEVVVAEGGRAGIAAAVGASASFDVVLCDLMMPDAAGWEVRDAVAAQRPELYGRFVFLTGGAYSDESQRFLARADVSYLKKPFDLAELRRVVEDLGQIRRSSGSFRSVVSSREVPCLGL